MKAVTAAVLLLCAGLVAGEPLGRLRVSGHRLVASDASGREHTVFLNGVNMAWISYAADFGNDWGNDVPNATFSKFESVVTQLSAAGGNCIRFWVHCDGRNTPSFASDGQTVNGTDIEQWAHTHDRLIPDMQRYLDIAHTHGVKFVFSLFSFGINKNHMGLLEVPHPEFLQSYVKYALTPIVQAVGAHPALAAWEVCNEPEGMTTGITCGGGWEPPLISVTAMQAFINRVAGAIHSLDSHALVTTGSWSMCASTDKYNLTNLYTDERLIAAGGDKLGTLDFQEVHWYKPVGTGPFNPFAHQFSDYGLSKPLIIGEFSQSGSQGMYTIDQMYTHAVSAGYSGAWGWQATGGGQAADPLSVLLEGVKAAASGV